MGRIRPRRKHSKLLAYWPGGIDADMEMGLRMLLMQLLKTFAQSLVAGVVLHDEQLFGGRLAIRPQKGNDVAVASGVDADADGSQALGRGRQGRAVGPGCWRGGGCHGNLPVQ